MYKNSITSFCGMCCTECWSPNLVKSSGCTSGGSTAYRLIERVVGLRLVVIFRIVFCERSDRGQLSNSSSRQLVDQGPVVQRLDNAIHRINRYLADKC